ncbi:MAG: tetratricopeptide repeat protein, partial [Prolixibacteraceae bacterium]|nr:tetratricopeptide repeat protein [Prolixibacteraceae bacterium]
VNSLGYFLLNQDKMEEALRIFKLNTELYPDGFNTYDSYGECLLRIGKNEEALAAFRKSLELNPDNKNAEKKISELE